MAYTGTAPFGLGAGSMLGPSDLYRPLGLAVPHHQRAAQAPTTSTSPTSAAAKFHQQRSPFAIQQLLGLGQDKKTNNDQMMSVHRDDYPPPLPANKNKDYREFHDKLR